MFMNGAVAPNIILKGRWAFESSCRKCLQTQRGLLDKAEMTPSAKKKVTMLGRRC